MDKYHHILARIKFVGQRAFIIRWTGPNDPGLRLHPVMQLQAIHSSFPLDLLLLQEASEALSRWDESALKDHICGPKESNILRRTEQHVRGCEALGWAPAA